MSTGMLLFLVFVALSVLDGVARARRKQAALPPAGNGESPGEGEARPPGAGSGEAEGKDPSGSPDDFLNLEKLMGPGYLERLMGVPGLPGTTGEATSEGGGGEPDGARVAEEEDTVSSGERLARPGARALARRERRISEAKRRLPESGGWRSRVETGPGEGDRRLPDREDETGFRPAPATRETTPFADSPAAEERRPHRPAPVGAASGAGRAAPPAPARAWLHRDLFGDGDRYTLRRAFVIKEVLQAPVSERRRDAR